MRGQTASTRGVEGTVFRALGDTAPVQGTHSWGRWRRQSQKKASRKSQEGMLIAFPAARGAVWRCSGQGPACRPRPAERTPQTALSIETAPEAQAEESARGQLGTTQVGGLCSTVARTCWATVSAPWSRVGHLPGHGGALARRRRLQLA